MMQIIKQTDKEKIKMYNKMSKKKLIEMLIQANKVLDSFYRNTNLPYNAYGNITITNK
jgi:hypothetical protein